MGPPEQLLPSLPPEQHGGPTLQNVMAYQPKMMDSVQNSSHEHDH